MDCKKCKSAEIRPSQRNFAERAFGYIIPLRPYRCEECDLRQWGVMRPILERPRLIAWGGLLLIIALFVLNAVLVIPVEPEPYPTATATETKNTATEPPATEPAGDQPPTDTATDGETTTSSTSDEPANQTEDAPMPTKPANNKQTQAEPRQPATETQSHSNQATMTADETKVPFSDFVRQRQAQNLAKQNGVTRPKNTKAQKAGTKNETPVKTQTKAAMRPTSVAKSKNTSPAPKPKPSPSGSTATVAFSHHLNGDILTIDVVSAGPMGEAKIKDFLLDQKKLIIDFPGKFRLKPETMTVQHREIRQVRTGLHRDYMRLVLDLTDHKNPQPEITLTQAGATIRIGR